MPQIFQVLKCYKCSIFQVHQTKKDIKWQCKVCGEKQSVKRHYGLGTAKDCRVHVQKLNNMQGDIEESKLKTIDSEDSDYDDKTQNIYENKLNSPESATCASKKKSKWLAFVEHEEISIVNEPEYIDNVEVCLELPQKRKINKKKKVFHVPKVLHESNTKVEVMNEIMLLSRTELTSVSSNDNIVINHEFGENSQHECREKSGVPINISENVQATKPSKWAQYVADDDTEITDVQLSPTEIDVDEHIKTNDKIYSQDEENYCDTNLANYIENESHHCDEVNAFNLEPVPSKHIFSLCDDNDLDNILDI